jgi:signal transduction histidine kinase
MRAGASKPPALIALRRKETQAFMPDYYHAPALILTALLLPAFGYLYLRFRDTRTLLWFLGFAFALVAMLLLYTPGARELSAGIYPRLAVGETSFQISTGLFLASLSPLSFRLGRFKVLYAIPYMLPLVVASVLLYGVFGGTAPQGPLFLIFPVLMAACFTVGMFWGASKGSVPLWLGVSFSFALGVLAVWVCLSQGSGPALTFAKFVNLQMAVVLLIFVFRRFTPGVALSVLGFETWSLFVLRLLPWIVKDEALNLPLARVMVMGKVVAAMGMILLALEDELAINRAAREREHRARRELEAYTKLILPRRRVEDFDQHGTQICETVVTHSRFGQAALLLGNAGRYRLAGWAGLDAATAKALGELAARISGTEFLTPGSAPSAIENSLTLQLDLTHWLLPGDDLKRLRFTSALAAPMSGRSGVAGALLLAGMRAAKGETPGQSRYVLRADDLLPIEMLAARLQATRSQTMMMEKLIDSEKFSALGQLAGNVTQQLNNPLTVILGYAALLDEDGSLGAPERKGVESILAEARRMRSTLESLSRIARNHGDQFAAVSVSELLNDMEQLHRSEFLQRSIDFQLSVAPALPRVMCSAQQLRQAVLHCLQYAMAAVEQQEDLPAEQGGPKTIRLEASSEGSLVQIQVSHTGPGFLNPERAFDPYVPAQAGEETAGLGLSLCATILRDNNGRAAAVNLEPRGAAIILELRAA